MKDDQQLYGREQAFGGSQMTDDIMRAYGLSPEEAESIKRSDTPPDNYAAEILHPFVENLAKRSPGRYSFSSPPHRTMKYITSFLQEARCWFLAW